MNDSDLQLLLSEAAAVSGIDTRLGFARALPGQGAWRIEASDPAWLEAALERAGRAGLAARGHLLAAPADRTAWVTASVAEVRREPRHTAEQVTQALQGDTLEPLVHEDGWLLGRLPDGYVGWVRDWHLQLVAPAAASAFDGRTNARIDAGCIVLRERPRRDAAAAGESVLGTRVAVRGESRGWAEIELPGGRSGWVPAAALRAGSAGWPASAASILRMVQQFMGVPYVWGGRSPKGFDCSGLVQFVFGLHDVRLPRDSDQQARCGVEVDVPGAADLVFFGRERVTHVAVAESARQFLHARGEVRRNSTVPGTPLHDADLWAMRCGIRRVLEPAGPFARG